VKETMVSAAVVAALVGRLSEGWVKVQRQGAMASVLGGAAVMAAPYTATTEVAVLWVAVAMSVRAVKKGAEARPGAEAAIRAVAGRVIQAEKVVRAMMVTAVRAVVVVAAVRPKAEGVVMAKDVGAVEAVARMAEEVARAAVVKLEVVAAG
jgi:hypothetical protein